MFIAALVTIAKTRKQPKCPLTDELDKEDVVHTYNGILLNHKKERNNAICNDMDATRVKLQLVLEFLLCLSGNGTD